jgi:polyisoprenoid-binding protein YceI
MNTSGIARFGSLLFASAMAVAVHAETYQVDAAHTDVEFKVKHMGISTVTGGFTEFSGSFDVDPKNVKATKGSLTIDVNSITTGNAKRDGHLKSDDFFDAAHFPEMKFVSKEVRDINEKDSTCTLLGDLTIRGTTKEVALKVKGGGIVSDPMMGQRAAFSATGRINRLDYGLKWNKTMEAGGFVVSPEVDLVLNFEGVHKPEAAAKTESKPAGKAGAPAEKKPAESKPAK